MSIPKIIHMTWFSYEDYPEDVKRCISSWKEQLPDYEIRLWNIKDARKINIAYINEALNAKKWAFAADVVRLYALYEIGGVYMDTDIFLKERFDVFMREGGCVLFQEYHKGMSHSKMGISEDGTRQKEYVKGCGIQAAFMISEKGNLYIRRILDYYNDKHFYVEKSGKIPRGTLIAPAIYAIQMEQFGYKYMDEVQKINEKVTIFPSKFVAGHPIEETVDSFAIHYCKHSWYDFTLFDKVKEHVKKLPIINKILMCFYQIRNGNRKC